MKTFACGDVVPGCDATFVCATDDDILTSVARHAHRDHGLTTITAELADAVRTHIRPAALV